MNAGLARFSYKEHTGYVSRTSVPGRTWAPSAEELLEFEKGLPAYLKAELPEGLEGTKGWYRQYSGSIDERGVRILEVAFFCEVSNLKGWGEYPVLVLGAGSCHFEVFYDTDSRKFTYLPG